MLRWFRLHASRIAVSAIISLAALGGSAVSPHEDDCHDAACGAMAVEHDAAAHRIGGPRTGADAQLPHCLVCHFARSFRPQIEARLVSTPVVDTGTTVHAEFFTVARRAQVAQPPLRSPPAPPLHA